MHTHTNLLSIAVVLQSKSLQISEIHKRYTFVLYIEELPTHTHTHTRTHTHTHTHTQSRVLWSPGSRTHNYLKQLLSGGNQTPVASSETSWSCSSLSLVQVSNWRDFLADPSDSFQGLFWDLGGLLNLCFVCVSLPVISHSSGSHIWTALVKKPWQH